MNGKIKIVGRVHLICRDKDGNIKWEIKGKNQITYASLAVISGLMGNVDAQVAFTYLAVGTDSTPTDPSQTSLGAEIANHGLTRHVATVARTTQSNTNDTLTLTYVWTASGGGSDTIEEIGIFNDPTTGVMLGRMLTGSKVVGSGMTLSAEYDVQIETD